MKHRRNPEALDEADLAWLERCLPPIKHMWPLETADDLRERWRLMMRYPQAYRRQEMILAMRDMIKMAKTLGAASPIDIDIAEQALAEIERGECF